MATKQLSMVVNQRNFTYNPKKHATEIKGESMTVPDESFTIPEILEKFTRGVDPMLSKLGHGFDEQDVDFEDLPENWIQDLTDIDEAKGFIEYQQEKIKELETLKTKKSKGKEQAEIKE